jgi:hypothetical protein
VPGQQLPLQRSNRRLDPLDLICQHLQYLPRHSRQAPIAIIANNGNQLVDIAQALRRHHSEPCKMCPQRVHQHRALAHQLLAAPMEQLVRLLLRRLDRHNRIVGRPTASQIASASAASCLLRLMYAFTYCAGISRTSWPSAPSSRAQ